jgi:NADH-quinone oxidoreductase subunit K
MLNAVNLLFVAFTYHQDAKDKFLSFLMAVAAAEVAGLAILVSIFRNLGSIDINLKNLKG